MNEKNADPPCGGRPAEPRHWKPPQHELSCLLLGNGYLCSVQWSGTDFEHGAWQFGNCSRNLQEARQTRDVIQEVWRNLYTKSHPPCP